uniref:hypothetical protein n=1 Tax=Ornithinimicrobium sp. CNJ-824 TaxID=1904966 RepID=UPI0031583D82
MNTPIRRLAYVVLAMFTALLLASTWIQFVQADDLRERPNNRRTLIDTYSRERGAILVDGDAVARSWPPTTTWSGSAATTRPPAMRTSPATGPSSTARAWGWSGPATACSRAPTTASSTSGWSTSSPVARRRAPPWS